MSFVACTKTGTCVRGYPATRYNPRKCEGCTFVSELHGGDNAPTKADGTALTKEEQSAVYRLKK